MSSTLCLHFKIPLNSEGLMSTLFVHYITANQNERTSVCIPITTLYIYIYIWDLFFGPAQPKHGILKCSGNDTHPIKPRPDCYTKLCTKANSWVKLVVICKGCFSLIISTSSLISVPRSVDFLSKDRSLVHVSRLCSY